MTYSTTELWTIIALLGIGTYLIRFSFLGPLGRVQLPPFVLRLLRYTPVAVLPALVAPLVLWPAATDEERSCCDLRRGGGTFSWAVLAVTGDVRSRKSR